MFEAVCPKSERVRILALHCMTVTGLVVFTVAEKCPGAEEQRKLYFSSDKLKEVACKENKVFAFLYKVRENINKHSMKH